MNYKALRKEVTGLLKEFGQKFRLIRQQNISSDPVTGTVTGSGQTSFTLVGVILTYAANLVDGEVIRVDDRLAYVQADVRPELGDVLIDNTGQEWNVVNYDSVEPAGVSVLYTLQLRR